MMRLMRLIFSSLLLFLVFFQMLAPTVVLAQNKQCVSDTYIDPATGKSHITFCSVSPFSGPAISGYDGCQFGESCRKGPEQGSQSCEWSVNNGKLTFCMGGFPDDATLRASRLEFQCVRDCGGGITGPLFGGNTQTQSLAGSQIASGSQGKYTCFQTDFDGSVKTAIEWQVNSLGAACTGVSIAALSIIVAAGGPIVATGIAGAGIVGAATTTIGLGSGAAIGTGCMNALANSFKPVIESRVILPNGTRACTNHLSVVLDDAGQPIGQGLQASRPFVLCNQIPAGPQRLECQECEAQTPTGVWTALGCIRATGTSVVSSLITIGLSIAGAVALLMIIAAGFIFSTSQGDPKRTAEAKDLVTAAVIGLLFIIFSVTILQFIGVQVLRIPGFGV